MEAQSLTELTPEKQLQIISKAWGKQEGYCFFPWIPGDANTKEERIRGYHEGPAFLWPRDKAKILAHMRERAGDDLYWCPSLFERNRRGMELAMDEHALWADLDEVDPRSLDEYPPTVAWETSPGHYQALWLLGQGDLQGASWPGQENQRLTYYIGADISGWDTTQLLRVPGWPNHKPQYREENDGRPVRGKLLWTNGRRYLPDDFEDLPEVETLHGVETVLEDQLEAVDRMEAWGRVRLKVSKRVREALARRDAALAGEGNEEGRSGMLWEIERELADAGCTVPEIVAIVRESAWNKFAGRADELKRLTLEASKAIQNRPAEKTKALEQEREELGRPSRLFLQLKGVRQPSWLVRGVWVEGGKGFIAGQPKSWKSWIAIDFALSVATGMPFLDAFPITKPGPVLLVEEEDSLPLLKKRMDKMWPGKQAGKLIIEDGKIMEVPPSESYGEDGPDLDAFVQEGFTLSEPRWQAWLDEQLDQGDSVGGQPYRLVVLDPLMMITGEIEESKSSDMNEKVYRPLAQLAKKYDPLAICIVHHMRKGGEKDSGGSVRGGQRMLGSVATHGFSENSLYLTHDRGSLRCELESKHEVLPDFKIHGVKSKGWAPVVAMIDDAADSSQNDRGSTPETAGSNGKRTGGHRPLSSNPVLLALSQYQKENAGKGPTIADVGRITGKSTSAASKIMLRLEKKGLIKPDREGRGARWHLS